MSDADALTAWDLRRRLGLAVAPLPAPGTAPDAVIRQICAQRRERDALPIGSPAWRAADLAAQELVASLARGGLTRDGIVWLIRRLDPQAPTRAAASPPPSLSPPPTPTPVARSAPVARSPRGRVASGDGTRRRQSLRSAGT